MLERPASVHTIVADRKIVQATKEGHDLGQKIERFYQA
jgi:hypothetical protein